MKTSASGFLQPDLQGRIDTEAIEMPRRLGQHFLVNKEIATRMVESAAMFGSDTIIEIGPGKGALTEQLAQRAKKVIAVEKDRNLAEQLKGKWKNVEIIEGDILKIKWPAFDKIVANIPYEISSPLLEKIFELRKPAILMLQKEFAARLMGKPGTKDYSKLSLAAQYFCNIKKVMEVKRGSFRPVPRVDSAIVRLVPKEPEFLADKYFWSCMAKLFQHKKRTIRAAIKSAHLYDHYHGNAIPLHLPDRFEKKRIFQCPAHDLKEIVNILREHMH